MSYTYKCPWSGISGKADRLESHMVQVHQLKHHLPSAEALLTGGLRTPFIHGSDQDTIFTLTLKQQDERRNACTNKEDNVVAVMLCARHSRCLGLVTSTPSPTVTDSEPNDC